MHSCLVPVATALGISLLISGTTSAAPQRPAPRGAEAQESADTRVKIVPKPVPCVPCPCECPDVRGPAGTVATAPVTPQSQLDEPRAPERGADKGPERVDRAPEARPAPAAPPPAPPKGTITGDVMVHERGGRDRADRSDVVVYIEKMPKKFAALKRQRRMAQRDKSFTPRVVAVTRGSTVEFPNEDKFFHNVFSLSEGNTFDLGLYRAGTSKSVTFEKTGVVDVYCNIHPNMWAQILVLDNPFYAVTAADGTFEIPKVPPGSYTLVAWLSGGEPVRQQIKVEPGGKATAHFELREGATSKPHLNKFNQPYGRYK